MSVSGVDAIQELWEGNDRKIDQKFYAAYSIFSSAVLDYAVARYLERRSVYSWSIIAYYYSMLHTMRLLCFIAVGDFPKSHEKIVRLFEGRAWRWSERTSWVRKSLKISENLNNIEEFDVTLEHLLSKLGEYGLEYSEKEIRYLGEVMEEAKKIRESVNYEGLLIVHQFWHPQLTSKFKEAVDLMQQASEAFLKWAVEAFLVFIRESDHLENFRGRKWASFLLFEGDERRDKWSLGPDMNYGMNRLIGILSEEYKISKDIRDEVISLLGPVFDLEHSYEIVGESANEVLENITLSVFEGKKNVMDRFEDHIRSLRGKLSSNHEESHGGI